MWDEFLFTKFVGETRLKLFEKAEFAMKSGTLVRQQVMITETVDNASQKRVTKEDIQFVLDTISKEVREDPRLVQQIFHTLLSAYTNVPPSLSSDAPTGSGKSYALQKASEYFPQEDITFTAGMSNKALLHRHGKLVIKNDFGEYEPIDDHISQINTDIMKAKDVSERKKLEEAKKELEAEAYKLIDLSHKRLL